MPARLLGKLDTRRHRVILNGDQDKLRIRHTVGSMILSRDKEVIRTQHTTTIRLPRTPGHEAACNRVTRLLRDGDEKRLKPEWILTNGTTHNQVGKGEDGN